MSLSPETLGVAPEKQRPPAGDFINCLLLFLLVLGAAAYILNANPGVNVLNRLNLAYAVVYQNSLNVDAYHKNTIDTAYYKGHYYCSEAIGGVIPAAAVLWAYRELSGDGNPNPLNPRPLYIITLFMAALPAAALAALMYRRLGLYTMAAGNRLAAALAFSLGTLVFPYSTLFYSYMPAMLLCFCSFMIMDNGRRRGGTVSPGGLAAAGFLASYSIFTSYDTVIIAAALTLYLFTGLKDKRKLIYFIIGAAPPVVAQAVYNYVCFDSVFSFGLFMLSNPAWSENKHFSEALGSFFSLGLDSLYSLLLKPGRGLLWLSPFLVFAVPGMAAMVRRKDTRAFGFLCAGVVFLYIYLISRLPDWLEGSSPGPRYLTPAMLFACPPIFFWLHRAGRAWRAIFISLAAVSAAQLWIVTATDPHVAITVQSPFFEYCLPLFLNGCIAGNLGRALGLEGLISLIPFGFFAAAIVVAFVPRNRRVITLSAAFSAPRAWLVLAPAAAAIFFASGYHFSDARSPVPAYRRAGVYMGRGMYSQGIRDLSDAIDEPGGGKWRLYKSRGIGLLHLDNYEKAFGDFESALRLREDFELHIHVANTLAHIYLDKRNPKILEHAAEHLKKALVMQPGNIAVRENLMTIYASLGHREDALKQAGEILGMDPKNTEALRLLNKY